VTRDYVEALAWFRKAASDLDAMMPLFNMPLYPWALVRQGNVLDLLGDREEAIRYYGKAREAMAPDDPRIAYADAWTRKPFIRPSGESGGD
jgi:tetratricopeptide (TPR) repeat protein